MWGLPLAFPASSCPSLPGGGLSASSSLPLSGPCLLPGSHTLQAVAYSCPAGAWRDVQPTLCRVRVFCPEPYLASSSLHPLQVPSQSTAWQASPAASTPPGPSLLPAWRASPAAWTQSRSQSTAWWASTATYTPSRSQSISSRASPDPSTPVPNQV